MSDTPESYPDDVSLKSMLVGEIAGQFVVPSYQRGYRWGEEEVTRLLEDIAESDGTYYLQPVVVKSTAGGWELVDGQQRLTTIYLIFRELATYMPKFDSKYTIAYDTRKQSSAFLNNPTEKDSRLNVDFHFIYRASKIIREWFEARPDPSGAAIDYYQALTKRVNVIWYEAPDEVDSRTLFTRLNIGRIPLTNSELVKAMILSRSDRREEVAAQWDAIERDLRSHELWAFATGDAARPSNHISLLLDTYARLQTSPPIHSFHTFEVIRKQIDANSAKAVWDDIVDLHSLIIGWYDDHNLFHKIGFLVLQGHLVGDFVKEAIDMSRSDFDSLLKERIAAKLNITRSALTDLVYEDTKCKMILELMNVETVRKRGDGSHRYSFADHVKQAWSLEHIHAQSAEHLDEVVQWTSWLKLHRDALHNLPDPEPEVKDDLVDRINNALPSISSQTFHQLEHEIIPYFTKSGVESNAVHAVSNLALLARGDNSALNNSCFEVKRRDIIQRDRDGSYVPPATRNVFLKYYTETELQLHFWGPQDRSGYFDAIVAAVKPYLSLEEENAHE